MRAKKRIQEKIDKARKHTIRHVRDKRRTQKKIYRICKGKR